MAIAITRLYAGPATGTHRELAQWALASEFDEVTYAQRFFAE
jgi:hypothetical protein